MEILVPAPTNEQLVQPDNAPNPMAGYPEPHPGSPTIICWPFPLKNWFAGKVLLPVTSAKELDGMLLSSAAFTPVTAAPFPLNVPAEIDPVALRLPVTL